MRRLTLCTLISFVACSSSTESGPVRYNFRIVDGLNQQSVAGAATLAKPITSQLTRDPQGEFATRLLDFLKPAVAYAQSISLAGDPVANAIVCGRESAPGEPKVVPLCAFTLADGKAANSVEGGTKAGTYTILFTAQVPSQVPVVDSTTVVVDAGPMASTVYQHGQGFSCWTALPDTAVKDSYGNAVPYRFVTKGELAHVASDIVGTAGARTFVVDRVSADAPNQNPKPLRPGQAEYQLVDVEVAGAVVATGQLTSLPGCVDLYF